MKFLIDECLHPSLVDIARARHFEAWHVNWLGLSGEPDWKLMPRIVAEDFTFLTNNAEDFRKLYAREPFHAGLIIIVPQAVPGLQRRLFLYLLDQPDIDRDLINQVVELTEGPDATAIIRRYELPKS